jgi:putative aminopeptidase FrvX
MTKIAYDITESSRTFLFQYLNNAAPTGFEVEGQKIWLDYIKPYIHEYQVDNYGTVVGIVNPEAPYKVVIEAHADEISWFVSYISDNGFIQVIRNGGSDHMIAPSKRVNIHTKNGFVKGVFGWPAIHLRNGDKETPPSIKNITIDVGASTKKEVEEMGIHVGCVITYEDELMVLNNKYLCGRALDNRIGGFMIAEVARMLHENGDQLPFGLYIINSVQEEVGLRGAQMIVETVRPQLAIITDVTHDTSSPMIDAKVHGDLKCGSGPVITYAPAVQNKVREMVIAAAETNEIPFQRDAASRATGTDTDAFAYATGGVPSALISLPMRYMHTTVEMVSIEDVKNTISLLYASVLAVNPSQSLKYID